jgi:hypothetical protein
VGKQIQGSLSRNLFLALPISLISPHPLSIDTSSLSSGDIVFISIVSFTLALLVLGVTGALYQIHNELKRIKGLLSISKNQDNKPTEGNHAKSDTK